MDLVNESCPSQETGLVFPSKVFSFLGLSLINKNCWADHTKTIEQEEFWIYEPLIMWFVSDWKIQCIPAMSRVKCLLLLQDDPSTWMFRCYNPIAGKMPKIYIFLSRKFQKVKRTFLTPSWKPLNQFGWNLANLLSDSFPQKPCLRFLFSLSVFE